MTPKSLWAEENPVESFRTTYLGLKPEGLVMTMSKRSKSLDKYWPTPKGKD
jgi:hypothetical protein